MCPLDLAKSHKHCDADVDEFSSEARGEFDRVQGNENRLQLQINNIYDLAVNLSVWVHPGSLHKPLSRLPFLNPCMILSGYGMHAVETLTMHIPLMKVGCQVLLCDSPALKHFQKKLFFSGRVGLCRTDFSNIRLISRGEQLISYTNVTHIVLSSAVSL